ncbi:hypothetical protein LTR62_005494 [Meristemomyces frigidus]|uniref:Uncharacterized protein n=1 Tax=Meristemomyces frigidus TaxID=1508187 RepID=A0AAN7YFC1_9PEZI|nr:hypothetical protein LTR62_005494 [Meristemomyces frigidus]
MILNAWNETASTSKRAPNKLRKERHNHLTGGPQMQGRQPSKMNRLRSAVGLRNTPSENDSSFKVLSVVKKSPALVVEIPPVPVILTGPTHSGSPVSPLSEGDHEHGQASPLEDSRISRISQIRRESRGQDQGLPRDSNGDDSPVSPEVIDTLPSRLWLHEESRTSHSTLPNPPAASPRLGTSSATLTVRNPDIHPQSTSIKAPHQNLYLSPPAAAFSKNSLRDWLQDRSAVSNSDYMPVLEEANSMGLSNTRPLPIWTREAIKAAGNGVQHETPSPRRTQQGKRKSSADLLSEVQALGGISLPYITVPAPVSAPRSRRPNVSAATALRGTTNVSTLTAVPSLLKSETTQPEATPRVYARSGTPINSLSGQAAGTNHSRLLVVSGTPMSSIIMGEDIAEEWEKYTVGDVNTKDTRACIEHRMEAPVPQGRENFASHETEPPAGDDVDATSKATGLVRTNLAANNRSSMSLAHYEQQAPVLPPELDSQEVCSAFSGLTISDSPAAPLEITPAEIWKTFRESAQRRLGGVGDHGQATADKDDMPIPQPNVLVSPGERSELGKSPECTTAEVPKVSSSKRIEIGSIDAILTADLLVPGRHSPSSESSEPEHMTSGVAKDEESMCERQAPNLTGDIALGWSGRAGPAIPLVCLKKKSLLSLAAAGVDRSLPPAEEEHAVAEEHRVSQVSIQVNVDPDAQRASIAQRMSLSAILTSMLSDPDVEQPKQEEPKSEPLEVDFSDELRPQLRRRSPTIIRKRSGFALTSTLAVYMQQHHNEISNPSERTRSWDIHV